MLLLAIYGRILDSDLVEASAVFGVFLYPRLKDRLLVYEYRQLAAIDQDVPKIRAVVCSSGGTILSQDHLSMRLQEDPGQLDLLSLINQVRYVQQLGCVNMNLNKV